MPVKLSRHALPIISGAARIPAYDAASLTPGIVHFGVGNFHRSHQAVYLDALFNLGLDRDWAIVGAGVRAADGEMRSKLAAQDYLTTVVEQDTNLSAARVTSSMIDFLPIGDAEAIIARLADPAIRIVSLTVTEGGYYIDPATQRFDATHPDIVADATAPAAPRTVFGLILAGLMRRRAAGVIPFTVMSCDNIPGNGHVTSNAITGLARLSDPEAAGWVEANVAFPNSMVDRITPATSQRERDLLANAFGIEDSWPVFCEEYTQWVLEDNFPAGRPALEKVGVQFVEAVAPFELMKIRILNGGHAAIAYPAGLLDVHFVHEALEDAQILAFLGKLEREEVIPTVPPVPDTDLAAYYDRIERRFANPKIGDTIARLCYDGANRQPKFILPTALARVEAGGSVAGLALVSALWARYCYGESDSGKAIAPNDPSWDRLQALAREAKGNPVAWLSMTDVFGELASNPVYVASFVAALERIWAEGTRAALAHYIAN
ncbi:MAG: mannitol dehydrogenase family protein [Hyphomicrobiales bacterium]|nr:MAG: mannitol dehydrogenase family protein [Hyphomicrobiales bacterium]